MIEIIVVINIIGGLGDMIRFLLSLFAFVQETPNTRMKINFENRLQLKPYFSVGDEYFSEESLTDKSIIFKPTLEEVKELLDRIRHDALCESHNETIYVTSNEVYFMPADIIRKHIRFFRENVLRPSSLVLTHLETVKKNHFPEACDIISMHIRCGDFHMLHVNDMCGDSRNDLTYIEVRNYIAGEVIRLVHEFKKLYPNGLLIIHSDNDVAKAWIRAISSEIILCYPSTICHTSYPEYQEDGYLSTIAEFFFISMSTHVVLIGQHYSGFSHIASVYGQVPYTSTLDPDSLIMKAF